MNLRADLGNDENTMRKIPADLCDDENNRQHIQNMVFIFLCL
jgi:hypothetical protein